MNNASPDYLQLILIVDMEATKDVWMPALDDKPAFALEVREIGNNYPWEAISFALLN